MKLGSPASYNAEQVMILCVEGLPSWICNKKNKFILLL